MDRATSEDKVTLRVRVLVNVSSLACIVTSLLYMLVNVMPLWYFNGYVKGYYSLLDYLLYYSHSGQLVFMPHTDYVKHASITFALLSVSLLVLSLLPLILSNKRLHTSTGLVFGVANGLGVLYGLLNGYLYRVASYDLGRFAYLMGKPNNEVVYRTLAGTIVFEGVKVEATIIYKLVFESPLLIIALTMAIATSTTAALTSLISIYRSTLVRGVENSTAKLRFGSACLAVVLLSLTALASTFTYYPSLIALSPQSPPATFEPPPYICVGLIRTSRGAIAYTDFETYPIPGWARSGGSWSTVSNISGAKGNVLQGDDDNKGLGKASYYYYNTSLNNYTSLWVIAKARRVSGNDWFGIALLNADISRAYVAGIEDDKKELEIRSFNVEKANGWERLNQVKFTYVRGRWYVLIANYVVTPSSVNITIWMYNEYGDYITTTSASSTHANRFTPAYIGIFVDNPTAQFDEFIISTVDPKSILFTGLQAGMSVEIWDNLGNRVANGTATGPSLTLDVVQDMVVGTGVDGRVIVRLPDGSICLDYRVPETDAILGGDTYRVVFTDVDAVLGANKTSATISVGIPSSVPEMTFVFLRLNTTQVLYARLVLDSLSTPATLNLDAWIEGATKSTNITIRNGVPASTSTSIIQLNLGLNNNLTLSGYFTAAGQYATLQLKLELYTAPGGMGACVRYPLTVMLRSDT